MEGDTETHTYRRPRWEPYLPQHTEAIYHFDYDRFRQGSEQRLRQCAGRPHYRGDPETPENGVNNRWLQFAPRVGLAWDVNGDGLTSVRTSHALGYLHARNFREAYSGHHPGRTGHAGESSAGWRIRGEAFPEETSSYELDQNALFPPLGLFYTQPFDLRTPTASPGTSPPSARWRGTCWCRRAISEAISRTPGVTRPSIPPSSFPAWRMPRAPV